MNARACGIVLHQLRFTLPPSQRLSMGRSRQRQLMQGVAGPFAIVASMQFAEGRAPVNAQIICCCSAATEACLACARAPAHRLHVAVAAFTIAIVLLMSARMSLRAKRCFAAEQQRSNGGACLACAALVLIGSASPLLLSPSPSCCCHLLY